MADDNVSANVSFSIPLLSIIKSAQQQHGLRHGDYQRYHQYITRKLRRMRKSLHFQQGTRSKVIPKKLTPEMVTDSRFILLKVFEIERSWAFAMQLKSESNTELRKRFQMISRLRKAVLRSDQLSELISNLPVLDAHTNLELKAYIQWIHGILAFESQHWAKAKEYLESTQVIYNGLMETVDEDGRYLYASRLDDILPQIHYCAYNIGDKSAATDLQRMRAHATAGESMGGFAASQLDELLNQARAKQAETVTECEWFGVRIPVKLEKAKMTILTVKESETEMLHADDFKSKLSFYDTILKSCVDAIAAVREEIRSQLAADASAAGGGGDKKSNAVGPPMDKLPRLHLLYNYLQFLKISKTIDRTLLYVSDALAGSGIEASGQVKNGIGTSSYAKPQELSRFYDTLVQNFQELLGLPGVIQESMSLKELLRAKMLTYRSYRCYYLAFTYVHAKRFAEGSALLMRAKRHAEEAMQSLSTAPWTEQESGSIPGPKPDVLLSSLSTLVVQIEAEDLTCRAAYMVDMTDSEKPSTSGQVAIKPVGAPKKVLLDRLDEFTDVKSTEKLLTNNPQPFVRIPPDFEPVPVKPVFFDLALNYINYPSLSDKAGVSAGRKGTQSSGIAGLVRGWLWGGGDEGKKTGAD